MEWNDGRDRPLRQRLVAARAAERRRLLLDLIRTQAAAALDREGHLALDPGRAFGAQGLRGRAAARLRERLSGATGATLPTTVLFDYPTPHALAGHLCSLLLGEQASPGSGAGVDPSAERRAATDEPIAIVGMGCRLPGGVTSPEDLWRLVRSETDAISEFPTDRGWDVAYDPDPDKVGTTCTRHAGFLYDAPDFDAGFFAISPGEAVTIDPQHRLLLETSWEAVERARIDPTSLHGTRTGAFVGIMYSEYGARIRQVPPSAEGYRVVGSMPSVASGRLAYSLGLEGPAVTVDTACSSSLVSLHLAAQSLRQGECTLALAGGVTVMATPWGYIEFSRQRGLAPDGRCRSFSADAKGSSWSEGVAVLVLERLSDARRNGHRVLAVVRGSAVNQDGASNGLTAPNGPAQQRVIRQSLAYASLSTADVDCVDAHGAGTQLGDPIEAQALLATYGQDRPADRPLWLGSLKSNVGHTQAAAGAAGVIKMVMAMRHAELPRSLHIAEPTPHVDWSSGAVRLLTQATPWPQVDRPRRTAVSSFGVGGTNAHVILEEAPPESDGPGQGPTGDGAADVTDPTSTTNVAVAAAATAATSNATDAAESEGRALPWLVSGVGEAGLRAQARRVAEFLQSDAQAPDVDLAYSLVSSRAALRDRAVVVAADRASAGERLAALADGDQGPHTALGSATARDRVTFVFPGQGSQWPGMAAELMRTSRVFRESIEACAESLSPHVDWSLTKVLRGESGTPTLDRVDVVQPALFAVMVSLAALWRSFGVEPAAVVGHSQGEIAAAHVAGALCLDDAARVVALRSRALRVLAGRGGMVSVACPEDRVRRSLARWDGAVSVAAVNGPRSVVISGEPAALDEALAAFEADGVRVRRIPVDYASHSAQVDEMRETLLATLDGVRPRAATVPFHSTVSGEPVDTTVLDAAYWVRNLRETVRFHSTLEGLLAEGHTTFIEMSPHPVLTLAIQETAEAAGPERAGDVLTVDSLRRNEGDLARFLTAVAEAHVHGVAVHWPEAFRHTDPRLTDVPTYAFQRTRYWLEDAAAPETDVTTAGLDGVDHPLLGAAVPLADGTGGMLFTGALSTRTHPWLADHAVADVVVVPGTALVEMALRAGARVGHEVLDELVLQAPLILPDQGTVRLQIAVGGPDDDGRRDITLYSQSGAAAPNAPWTRHAEGALARGGELPPTPPRHWPPGDAAEVELGACYEELARTGLHYGAAFQGLKRCWRRGDDLYVEVELPEGAGGVDRYGLHPALFDAVLHAAALVPAPGAAPGESRLPFSWRGVTVNATGATRLRAHLHLTGTGALSVMATDPQGRPVARVESLGLRPVAAASLRRAAAMAAASLLRLEWLPGQRPAPRDPVTVRWAWMGPGAGTDGVDGVLDVRGIECTHHSDPAALRAYLDTGGAVPEVVVLALPPGLSGHSPVPEPRAAADTDASADTAASTGTTTASHPSAPGPAPLVDPATAAHKAAHTVLAALQDWLADERLADSRLVVLTRGAVAVADGMAPDPALATVWGLVASAQSEYPDRIRLVDLDGLDSSRSALVDAVAGEADRVAVREGTLLLPRLARVATPPSAAGAGWRTDGTVLVTGGLGTLGRLVMRHVVESYGIRHLVVVSRSGDSGAGAAEFVKELGADGADIRVVAGDVADREVLTEALEAVPDGHPLTAVVHMAGVLDDGVLSAQTPERLDRVLRPKADGAWHLHELTADPDVAFVAFSSVSSVLGPAGQAGYAAANAFVDALMEWRRAAGLPGVSLGWGLWEKRSSLTAGLAEADVRRMARSGIKALSGDQGLALLDAARATGEPVVFPLRLDTGNMAEGDEVPYLLRAFAGTPVRRSAAGTDKSGNEQGSEPLAVRLAPLSESEQDDFLLTLVRTHVAAVLGYDDPRTVGERRPFADIGFDSLRALQLRNRLGAATGLRLSPTLVFDYPTPVALGRHLRTVLLPDPRTPTGTTAAPDAHAAPEVSPPHAPHQGDAVMEKLRSASRDEVFDYIDNLLGE
ncbi:SDR family NAD(P)-dependent oxidoreductase [Streptomyces sp. NA04227]|uniref:type I polyketide synthase n=1 Tax=Streptomyces sp. NA04227 TaxID=2742136 RepID=UPI0015913359|nr:type I polyketide synthase [Streptomyces sp. NA04227]QKW09724.1 SDR family NAD(P)-dependent oxidoreductase [Streptomyces sp. NA04227]